MGSHIGYIVPDAYATANKADLLESLPGVLKIDGFWTPPEQDVAVADRVFRELIHNGVTDPKLLFPHLSDSPDATGSDSLEYERNELALVSKNYDKYLRQYVGIIVDGQKLVVCNYSDGPKFDPSTGYLFIQKVFQPGGKVHFLQCRFDPLLKTCSNVSIIGSWQPPLKRR
jgi:hypothetical protein